LWLVEGLFNDWQRQIHFPLEFVDQIGQKWICVLEGKYILNEAYGNLMTTK